MNMCRLSFFAQLGKAMSFKVHGWQTSEGVGVAELDIGRFPI